MLRERRALGSTVTALVLTCVAVAISLAAAFWISGSTRQLQGYEKVVVTSSSCTYSSDLWTITITLSNEGPSNVTIKKVSINDFSVNKYGWTNPGQGFASTDVPPGGMHINSGGSAVIHVYIDGPEGNGRYASLTSGTSVNIIVQSATGMKYPLLILLQ